MLSADHARELSDHAKNQQPVLSMAEIMKNIEMMAANVGYKIVLRDEEVSEESCSKLIELGYDIDTRFGFTTIRW